MDAAQVLSIDTGYVLVKYALGKIINYTIYSPTGQLIKTSAERPLELGKVEEKFISKGKYKITVTYQDNVWSYVDSNSMDAYMRDKNGNLYGYGSKEVVRFSQCGKKIASLNMPASNILRGESQREDVEPIITVIEEYGTPEVAPNGDVYTAKRTPDKYSIIKWIWVDDPNAPAGPDAPTNFTVTASTTGLYLAWKASPQDPGCVSGYEISRSTSSGSAFAVLTTVANGVLNYNDTIAEVGTTYYYKLRAKSGTDFSPYTAEASGKRQ